MNFLRKIIIVFLIHNIYRCTIVPPSIYIGTERTALEKQLLGEFIKKEEFESFYNSSYSSFLSQYRLDSSLFTKGTFDTLKSLTKKRLLILDEILLYKKEGIIGEGNNGFLAIRDSNVVDLKKVKFVVSTENEIREKIITILSQILKKNKEKIKKEMYSYQIYILPTGYYYQDEKGRWRKKD